VVCPESDKLIVEAKVQPQDVDQLYLGQSTTLRFSAFNQRTTPELNGVLSMVSPDVTADPKKPDQSYYVIRIKVSDDEVARLGAVKLVPGMPVEAFVKTDERTVMSYLVKPFKDQVMRAFREK
jgi:membrane fusion protein, type I secretion system